jgi:FtsP/CotA-like multicopper oxidase with cupredoxin domain
MGRIAWTSLLAALALAGAAASAGVLAPTPTPVILANDNRVPAGVLSHGVLRIALDARNGLWYPDGPNGADLPVEAFGESGRALQIPGPLVRVPVGTEIVARIRNSMPGTLLSVHGLTDRPTAADRPLDVRYGRERGVRFRAGAAGTYFYWGTTTGNGVGNRTGRDTQLSGAIVVDDPHSRWNARNDRIFVVDEWDGVLAKHKNVDFDFEVQAINGREYPQTERLIYPQGALVHWRVVNTSWQDHPFHLHGFYFSVDSRGDGLHDDIAPPNAYHDRRVTELVPSGSTETLTWRASRPGNWLFHCHIAYHTTNHAPFSTMGNQKAIDAYDQFLHMGGLILAITVTPKNGRQPLAADPPARHLTLVVEPVPREAPDVPAFRYALVENGVTIIAPAAVGPPIVLTRGKPVDITVANHLSEPTAVHWHGIEQQDSYYDGVPMISGYGKRLEPMIMPGRSFDARFTPPRAGTFIYHTHMNDATQSMGGLSGAMIVLPPGERFDPATDHIVEMSTPRDFNHFFDFYINGTAKPATLTMAAGVAQRFRFINMTMLDSSAVVSVVSATKAPATWRPLAVDGADLPAMLRIAQPAIATITIGQTRDFLFEPRAPGEYKLMFWGSSRGRLRMTIPVHVVATTVGKVQQ